MAASLVAVCGTGTTPTAAASLTGNLYGVSCPTATSCFAVGTVGPVPLMEHWDGRAWKVVDGPGSARSQWSILNGVACAAANRCVAVGTATTKSGRRLLFEQWDGRRWSTVAPPGGTGGWMLGGVSCASATACIAVGSVRTNLVTRPVALRWNGAKWAVIGTPPTNDASLTGVSCSGPTTCVAVGERGVTSGPAPYILRWNGTSWATMSSPAPSDGRAANLNDVSCPSATRCVAVGGIFADRDEGLVLSRTGNRWSLVSSAPGRSEYVAGVSCPNPTNCFAAGSAQSTQLRTFVTRLRGSTWSATPSPNVAASDSAYNDIACASPTSCQAVGRWSRNQGSETYPLTAHWDGTRWSSA